MAAPVRQPITATVRWLQVQDQSQGLVHLLHLLDGQKPDWLGEAIEVNGVELIAHDQRVLVTDDNQRSETGFARAGAVKATIQVLRLSQSGCRTTANRRPLCSCPFPRAGIR